MHNFRHDEHNAEAEQVVHEYESAYRRHESTLESQSPLGIGIELEKDWTPADESSLSRSSTEHISEPEKVHSKSEDETGDSDARTEPTPVHRTITAQDWTGPDDPENPHNGPKWKKIYHAIPCALFGFVVYVVPILDDLGIAN